MRILFVSSWYPPVLSGSSLWCESLVRALQRRGHDVRVVTTTWPGAPTTPAAKQEEVLGRLPARVLPKNRFVAGLPIVPVAWSPANRREIVALVREFRPHVIHQINHIFDTLFLSAHAAAETRTPLIGSITTPIQSMSPILHGLLRGIDLAANFNFGVRHWRRIICSDSTQAAYARNQYGSRVRDKIVDHIFVGVHQRVQAQTATKRSEFAHIVTVGHVHKLRNPTKLIEAMPYILEEFPDAKFDIAGRVQFDEPEKAVRRLKLDHAVRLLGEVPTETVVDLVSRARVFSILHQCRYAGLSFTAIEAMQFGTPVLINAPRNLYGPDVIRDGENIVLVPRDDERRIAEKTLALLRDPSLRDRIGLAGQTFVRDYLNWDRNAELTEAIYRDVIR